MIEITHEVTISPSILAKAFWDMTSDKQAEFFNELKKVIQEDHLTNPSAYGSGELQWYHLAHEMKSSPEAKDMLMTLAAPLYLSTLEFTGN